MSVIQDLLKDKQKELLSKLEGSSHIPHCTGQGDHTESSWRKFLENILPKKYGIDRGYLIDSYGNVSDQIDAIIYDALYSPLIMISESGEKFIPVEAVYSIIEIKPTINKKYLEYANDKIESVKKLKRSSRGMTCAGKRVPPRELTNILGIILATDVQISKTTLEKNLKIYNNIDIGCAVNNYTFNIIRKNGIYQSISYTEKDESILGLFFNLHNRLHEIGTVAAIDIRKYANALDSFNFNIEEEF